MGRRDKQKRQLDNPEKEVSYHAPTSNACAGGQGIVLASVVALETPPDGRDHNLHRESSVCALDPQPEHCEDAAADDTEITKIVAESRTDNDTKGDMELRTDTADLVQQPGSL